jgi:hypothetical protein
MGESNSIVPCRRSQSFSVVDPVASQIGVGRVSSCTRTDHHESPVAVKAGNHDHVQNYILEGV